ncbi:metallophosphoesterase [Dongia sp.]|uniref:metallophosphoesterase family protein n=1 Tax=Dongia sp. TaxID=1977262 RepID=UPI0035B3730F
MKAQLSRRDALKLAAIGGVVFASRLVPDRFLSAAHADDDFYFVQISDTHWGFDDPTVNPDPRATLAKSVEAINGVSPAPDFVVFTGDLTHKTKDAAIRRRRMAEFKEIVSGIKVPKLYFLPGEHDADMDRGAAFKEFFGETHQSFTHKGVYFATIDNVSDPDGIIGIEQLTWLRRELAALPPTQPVVLFTHRPLFDLKADWDWFTKDGPEAVELLKPFQAATVFYGHVHQENHHMTGNVAHISARSAMYPLPAPGSQPKKAPLPWDPAAADHGIGWRQIGASADTLSLKEYPTT